MEGVGCPLPESVHEDVVDAFKKFIVQNWKDALNVAAAEPGGWEVSGGKAERSPAEKAMGLAGKL